MPKLPSVTANEIIKALKKIGFVEIRQKGSHLRLKHPDNRIVTIPVHSGKILGKGLLKKILRDSELSIEELIELL
ncbi:type II toxin-antitoxin system HicA family toxin [Geminocystis sp. GBBB08]|uniref:type II toxin-antitoxin system HicA family toxin n=1 Tax=Geminocystis sp. GBBB08 TaxID=2604140 RepID=UPI0027E2E9BA|nr:type II toxin-antitoxin system HicA family toxin [Geminocystis sp. GBBB08]MBL1209820.1 type II toxin-antitoxin system HicA family toxin [Geminocystis sp. GBBB08]